MKSDSKSILGKIRRNLNWNGVKKIFYRVNRPFVKMAKQNNIRRDAKTAQMHYAEVINAFRKSGRTRINFAAYVIFDSTYGMDSAFRKMMNDPVWNPKVVIIPDVSRGVENSIKIYNKTKVFFTERYGAEYVIDGWNQDTGEYLDLAEEFDIIYYANPYDSMVHEYHKIEYASKKNVLPIYISYGYDVGKYTTLDRIKNPELNLVWKCFADTTYMLKDYKKHQIVKGANVVLAGYSKMDDLAKYTEKQEDVHRDRKKILLAAHHTVASDTLPMSNFLKYYDLILRLPDIFKNTDFVFRPHPLLFTMMVNNKIWTEEEVNQYIEKIQKNGVEYSTGGDYLNVFAECDAIVNDCGSFTVEWLYTGKPGCFVYNDKLNSGYLTTLMNKAISSHTVAHSEEDIIIFIKNVIGESNCSECKMEAWVEDNIALNYPRVSSFILDELNILR